MLNIYFGGSTVFGKRQNKRKQRFYYSTIFHRVWEIAKDDVARFHIQPRWGLSLLLWFRSTKDKERKGKGIMDWVILVIWDLWSLTKTKTMRLDHNQVGFVDSVSGSVLSLSWSSSTGFPSDSVEIYDLMRKENLICISFRKAVVMCIYYWPFTTPNWPRKVHEMNWTIWYAFSETKGNRAKV